MLRNERPILGNGEALIEPTEKVRGGPPDDFHPIQVAEARRHLAPQIDHLRREAARIPDSLRGPELVFQARLRPNYLAASYFPEKLLEHVGMQAVGSRSAREDKHTKKQVQQNQLTKTLLLAGSERSIAAFSSLVHGMDFQASEGVLNALRTFSVVDLSGAEDVIRARPAEAHDGVPITWEAVLHRTYDDDARRRDQIFDKWVSFIESLAGAVKTEYRRVVEGITFVPISLPANAIDQVVQFNPLRAVRPMPTMRPTTVSVLRVLEAEPKPQPPFSDRPVTSERVAVFDGGIDLGCAYLKPFSRCYDLTGGIPADADAVTHGTVVTSTMLFGYAAKGQRLRRPDVYVDHFRVLPVPSSGDPEFDLELNWIVDQVIREVSSRKPAIVNLSIGPNEAMLDDEPSRWTAELDSLAHRHGVTFVNAVGNNGGLGNSYNRVQPPGDMVNAIGVGACCTRDPRAWKRASYSAIGPGRSGNRVQPTGVAFGGEPGEEPFIGVGPNGHLIETAGTSFATPLVAHGLSELRAMLGDRGDAATLRAFAVHSADPMRQGHDHAEVGHGRFPERFDSIWNCAPNEVTLLYQDRIERAQARSILLPIPDGLPADARIHLSWTLCFLSPIDPSDGVDYTLAGLEAVFRPHARIFGVRQIRNKASTGEKVDIELQRERVAQLAAEGLELTNKPATHSPARRGITEQARRDDGKWETVMHRRWRPEAQRLFRPQLELQYYARRGGLLVKDVDPLSYTLLVTVRGPEGFPLYGRVRQQWQVLSPLRNQLRAQL